MMMYLFAMWIGAIAGYAAHALCVMAKDNDEK